MSKLILSLLFVMTAPFAYANSDIALDDVMSPEEIGAEVAEQYPEFLAETMDNLFHLSNLGTGARIEVLISKAPDFRYGGQTMWVYVDGRHTYTWPVSTGREKRENPPTGRKYFSSTPTGTWTPYGMTRLHRSRLWDANMPYAIWLTGGIAIHAALPNYERMLGQRASGGCIRLSNQNAATLFSLVSQYGRANTRVRVVAQ